MYYVTTFIPAIYYNHPLCRLAMLAPLEGGEFYSAFQRITIHVGMDRVLQAYRGMMRQLAAFEHYCVVKRGEGGEKMKLSQEIVDAAKLRMKLAISTTASGSLEGEEEKGDLEAAKAEASQSWWRFLTGFGVGGTGGAAVGYFGYAATLAGASVGAILGLLAGVPAYVAWKKTVAAQNPEAYNLTIAAILDKSQAVVKGNTEINTKLEVYYRLEQLRYKMNMFSSILADIMTPPDISPEELEEKAKAAAEEAKRLADEA